MRNIIAMFVLLGLAVTAQARRFELRLSQDGECRMYCYLPDTMASGRAVVACPGGGYDHLAINHEGHDWADYFNSQGIAYFVLKYRMPKGDRNIPMGDAFKAMRTVRDSARVWHVNPNDVGIMGSSAGGHLASTVSTHADRDARPDFTILFYPVISMDEKVSNGGSCVQFLGDERLANRRLVDEYSNQNAVKAGVTPRTIIFMTSDDKAVPPITNGIAYYEAMLRAGNECALHVYPTGGHGFGFRPTFAYHDEMLRELTAWLGSFKGRTTYDSYRGLIMAGYQGWHDCPDDGDNRGWYHYTNHGKFQPGSYGKQPGDEGFSRGYTNVDLWPDVSEYGKLYDTPFVFDDGTVCKLPSPSDSSTVDTHFRWMEEYGLDGVFMQRFVTEIRNPSGRNHFDRVLANAMGAANRHNRAISIMYDLSGMRPGEESLVLRDIQRLDSLYNMHSHRANPSYLWHNGKPLVAVWGVGFNDGRAYGFKEARAIIDGLRQMGFSILIGVPTYWRTKGFDTVDDIRQLHALIKTCDIVMPWFVGRYDEQQYEAFKPLISADVKWAKEHGVDYAPLCFPGFSWRNMHYPNETVQIARNGGSFFSKQLDHCISAGAEMIYIAMFDEIDEGTAIMKCASRVPKASPGATFVPMDGDLYLRIVGQAARRLRGSGM